MPVSNQGVKKGIPATGGVLFFVTRSGHSAIFCDAIKADNLAKNTQKGRAITGWLSKNFDTQGVVYLCD
jgi:hypothetical protein